MNYLLDTNAFWEVLKNGISETLPADLEKNGKISFCLSEISAMEIYSVLGKYLRGSPNLGVLSQKEGKRFKKLIDDVLNENDSRYEIEIISLSQNIVNEGKFLLVRYAFRFNFHSLDSLIAATAKISQKNLITFDKALKNVLREDKIPFFHK